MAHNFEVEVRIEYQQRGIHTYVYLIEADIAEGFTKKDTNKLKYEASKNPVAAELYKLLQSILKEHNKSAEE